MVCVVVIVFMSSSFITPSKTSSRDSASLARQRRTRSEAYNGSDKQKQGIFNKGGSTKFTTNY